MLRAIPDAGDIRHSDVRDVARMDTSTCALLLRRLRALGLIAQETRRRGLGHGSGAPATYYALTDLGRTLRGLDMTTTDRGTPISTYSGLPFWPLAPRTEDVRIDDIAHALSNLCRFTGHVQSFYSVAQHSVLVSLVCDPKDALWGLLHDASEAYLCDISSPLKHTAQLAGYRDVEATVQAVIARAFGLPPAMPESVKAADAALLRTEQRDLMRSSPGQLPDSRPWQVQRITPQGPAAAKARFLNRFAELLPASRRAMETVRG